MSKLVILSGAGISADSGIQTFRDSDGLWENHSVDKVANGLTWKNNFDLVHSFYNARRAQLADVQPNAAHEMIARLQKRYETILMTQNIDDLFERGGCTNVIHLHGKLTEMKCENCGKTWDIGYTAWDQHSMHCPHMKGTNGTFPCKCRKGVRPNVVFFHEAAPEYVHMNKAFRELQKGDVFLVIGTSGQVINPSWLVATTSATTILSNLESQTGVTAHLDDQIFDHVLHGRASEKALDIENLVIRLLG